jgi:hypothetical protein
VNRKVKVPDALSESTTFTPFDRPGTTAWTSPGACPDATCQALRRNQTLGLVDQYRGSPWFRESPYVAMVVAVAFRNHVSGCGLWTGS